MNREESPHAARRDRRRDRDPARPPTATGSLVFLHPNDTGFWMFKEHYNLTLKQTFLTWTMMETLVAVFGLAGVLTPNAVL